MGMGNVSRGFTLLEVLIAAVVLVVGVTALTWAFSRGIFASADAENVDLALNIAQEVMEEAFYTLKTANLSTLDEAAFENARSGTHGIFSNFDVTVELDDDTDPMQVDVTVAWDTKGGEADITLTTEVAD